MAIRIYSPIKLIGMLIGYKAYENKIAQGAVKDASWYLSEEGKKVYQSKTSPAERMSFYYDYLKQLAKKQSKEVKDTVLQKLAYILWSAVENSSLSYAGYPEILQKECNPIVSLLVRGAFSGAKDFVCGGMLLLELLKLEKAKELTDSKYTPYRKLTYCEDDGDVTDAYRLERTVISAFCLDEADFPVPFCYDIVDSNVQDTDDDEDDDEADE
ncbi:MAG: hypothetical protein IJV96_07725 [Clostridia bacterium]|nr:hypothetical protein [Clostridia bacterium]